MTFTQAEIAALFEQSVQQFMLKGNSIGDSADFEYAQALFSTFLGYAREITIAAAFTGDVGGKALDDNKNEISPTLDFSPSPPESTIAPRASISGDFSSMGRIISTKPRSTLFKAVRIVPVQGEKLSALAVLSAPEASKFVEDYNKDVAFENKKAFQMDKVLQRLGHFTHTAD
ncbi:hypothetical protein TL16_g08876 [Triparma laevis f. inornata]|uniref:Uncharacterized protein n=1 Tax=Triparma laevis f. inornata TaxID=1714386 RepID=A0A9W7B009_9STRA|nr:hypothetical protein TL16_g08876 [Triparma laevis f. inornata]